MGLAMASGVRAYEAEVAEIGDVVVPECGLAAAQQRLDDAPHTGLVELVHELVEMRVASQNETLAGVLDALERNRSAAVVRRLVLEAGLAGRRVHQPGLAAGLPPDFGESVVGEGLAGFVGVLTEQIPDLALREIAEAEGLGLDVEGAATQHDLPRRRADAVVAHVAYTTQDDALREAPGPVAVPAAQLPEHRDQGVAHERVDLVDEQPKGFGSAAAHSDST